MEIEDATNKEGPPEDISDEDEEMDEEDAEAAKQEALLEQLDALLRDDPSNYQAHVDRVKLLKTMGELEKLRSAREAFSKAYPLSPDIWLEWVEDEKGLAVAQEEKDGVMQLFERATKDYVSPKVWLEYCQYALSGIGTEAGVAKAREVFESAIAAVGIDPSKGALVWEAYREFEMALVAMTATDAAKKAQKERVDKLFRRQLSVPLLDMESTMEEYREWQAGREPDRAVAATFKEAVKLMREREAFENALLQAEASEDERLKVYAEYMEFEVRAGLPVRIKCLSERRITDHCLVPTVWVEYLRYLDRTFKDPSVSLPVYERASRNCPWSGEIWVAYLRCLERHDRPAKDVVAVFERALQGGVTGPELLNVWLSFIDFKRRAMKYDDYEEGEREKKEGERDNMRELFGKAVEHLATSGADPLCRVARYWASMEGDRFRAMDEARKIWADVVTTAAGDAAKFWTEYLQLEKAFGDTKHLRKLFPKALERCKDWPETIGEMWLQFEREEGTLQQFEEAEQKLSKRMERLAEEREKAEAVGREEEKRKQEKHAKRVEKDKEKRRERRHDQAEAKRQERKRKLGEGEDGGAEPEFKKPALPSSQVKPPPGFKGDVKPPPGFKGGVKPPPGYKPPEAEGKVEDKGGDAGKDDRTVFVSNLDYATKEEELESILRSSGEITEVRLVKKPTGQSRGFAYVEFSDSRGAAAARARDREPLNGRPMFISPMNKSHQFQYDTGRIEEKKIFVSKLPSTVTKERLETLFGQYGKLVEVRLPTRRDGAPKAIAFIEFEEAQSAVAAVRGADETKLDGKAISVAISCPPVRKPHANAGGGGGASRDGDAPGPSSASSLGSGARDPGGGARRGRVQVSLVPRAVQVRRPPTASNPSAGSSKQSTNGHGNGSASEEKPRSNEDFRNMLLNKK